MKSNKYRALQKLSGQGIPTPDTLYLQENSMTGRKLQTFTQSFPKRQRYIVRSAIPIEDGSQYSYAGHFRSSKPVTSAKLHETINEIITTNKQIINRLSLKTSSDVMIQPYIEAEWGGVIFFPWKYFLGHALISHSPHGAEAVVSGTDSHDDIISLYEAYEPLRSGKLPDKIYRKLQDILKKIATYNTHPVDIEWAYTEEQGCMILQIRPLSMPLHGLYPLDREHKEKMSREMDTPLDELTIDATTMNLNHLSPLSFSRLRECYEQTSRLLRDFGIRCKTESFPFVRLPTGHILTNQRLLQDYYAFLSPLQSFLFPLRLQKRRKRLIEELEKKSMDPRSYFAIFQLANLACGILKNRTYHPLILSAFEYEIGFSLDMPPTEPLHSQSDWNDIRNRAKYLFLKNQQRGTYSSSELFFDDASRQEQELAYSLFDPLATLPAETGQRKPLKNRREIRGIIVHERQIRTVVQTEGPFLFVGTYFPNELIPFMKRFSAILLTKGNHLSHSAIVAREQDIPFLVGIPQDKHDEFIKYEQATIELPALRIRKSL